MKKKEIEVFGITYDRYVLLQLHKVLTHKLNLKRVIEMPSHGVKAAGSLYSIGFGLAGCHITLVNPEMEMMYGWEELGIQDQVETVSDADLYHSQFKDGQFDLAWNFVSWTELDDIPRFLFEMKRITNNYLLLITCNNFQPGYPWHRLIHKIYGFQWTHGQVRYNHITKVRKMFKDANLIVVEYGAIDTPGWPDPSGPRDIRLHKKFGAYTEKPYWEVPFIQYAKMGQYPLWMRALGKLDMTFRRGYLKLPLSHLFYVLGRKKGVKA